MAARNDTAKIPDDLQRAVSVVDQPTARQGDFCLLPPQSFAPFKGHRLSQASVVYSDGSLGLSTEQIVNEFGFAVPSEIDRDSFTDEAKIFYADRYGGLGVSRHGGSGRCGAVGRWQIKGIGRTPLLDRKPTESFFWHSHGGVALSDGLQEVIWSNLFQAALPYGAVRSPALISTHTKTWFEHEIGQKGHAPRILMLRDQALRPAHFERSVHFSMNPVGRCNDDVDRVRATILRLPSLLPRPRQRSAMPKLDVWGALHSGMQEMLRRFATQIAVSQSKRLVHGALGSANFCLDGRYIDFGTACQFPHFLDSQSYKLPPNLPTFWGHRKKPVEVADSLCFYINKYFPHAETQTRLNAKEFIDDYFECYHHELGRSFLSLCGFPSHLIEKLHSKSELRVLAGLLFSHACKRSGVVLPAQADLRALGPNDLEHLLRTFMGVDVFSESTQALNPSDGAAGDGLSVEIFRCAARVVSDEAQKDGIQRRALLRLMKIHMAKQLIFMPELSRDGMRTNNIALMNKYQNGIKDGTDIQQYIDELSWRGAVLLAPLSGYRTLLWRDHERDLLFDAMRDSWVVEDARTKGIICHTLDDSEVPYLPQSSLLLNLPLRELKSSSFFR